MEDILRIAPLLLILFRFFTGAIFVLFASNKRLSRYFIPLFAIGFFTDFMDGFISRRVTGIPWIVGRLDGYADTTLYISSLYYLWINHHGLIKKYLYPILGMIGAMLLSWLFCYIKFGRLTSYHGYSAKLWGVSIFLAVMWICLFKKSYMIPAMIFFGMINIIDEISITHVMPYWRPGVSSIHMAIRLADDYKAKHK